jgi:hypothetical protein
LLVGNQVTSGDAIGIVLRAIALFGHGKTQLGIIQWLCNQIRPSGKLGFSCSQYHTTIGGGRQMQLVGVMLVVHSEVSFTVAVAVAVAPERIVSAAQRQLQAQTED